MLVADRAVRFVRVLRRETQLASKSDHTLPVLSRVRRGTAVPYETSPEKEKSCSFTAAEASSSSLRRSRRASSRPWLLPPVSTAAAALLNSFRPSRIARPCRQSLLEVAAAIVAIARRKSRVLFFSLAGGGSDHLGELPATTTRGQEDPERRSSLPTPNRRKTLLSAVMWFTCYR